MKVISSAVVFVAFGSLACSIVEEKAEPSKPEPVLWAAREPFEPKGSLVEEHPAAFARISGWTTHVSGPVAERPGVRYRGSFGTGNGHAFGFVGLADPVNTLHSLTTPSYERGARYFGDYAIHVAPAGSSTTPDFDEEWAARSLESRALMTRGRLGDLRLDTVDFAPASDDPGLRTCFLRVLTLTNDGSTTSAEQELRVFAKVTESQLSMPEPGVLVEQANPAERLRSLTTGFVDGEVSVVVASSELGGGMVSRKVPALAPRQEERTVLYHCGSWGSSVTRPPAFDPGALLDADVAAYKAWEQDLLQVSLPDPMVKDLVDGMKLTLLTQMSAQGATCPMSTYTRTWARDNIGPVLAYLQLGAHEDARRTMDYIYGAVLTGGDLANSYDADLDLSRPPAPPDWDAMTPLGGSVGGETPSYMVWIYGAHYLHSGRIDRARERFGFLRRCLLAQDFGPDGLLPFTGDETYRAAMNAAFGLELEYAHHELNWSANSALLWLGAQKHFATLARELVLDADVAASELRQAEVQSGFEARYLLPNGCVSPLIERASGQAWPAPFEDVALKLTWAGWKSGDDAMARANMDCLMENIRTEPGRLQTLIDDPERYVRDYPGMILMESTLTGMLPGYALSAFTAVGHPEAEAAFNVMGRAATTSGNFMEYMVGDDLSGLSLIYANNGVAGDYTAKYRPWEGGINLDALLGYLVGYVPNEPKRSFTLRPHLPNQWPQMSFKGFRSGDQRFDIEVKRDGDLREVSVTSRAVLAYEVALRWDAPLAARVSIEVNGEALEATTLDHYEQRSYSVAAQRLGAGETLVFSVNQK